MKFFIGTYDGNTSIRTSNTSTNDMKIEYCNAYYNPRIVTFQVVQDPQGNELLFETYTISSYDKKNKLIGQIQFTGFYPNKGFFTSPSTRRFDITSSSGIYKCINKVIINFQNVVRIVTFIY